MIWLSRSFSLQNNFNGFMYCIRRSQWGGNVVSCFVDAFLKLLFLVCLLGVFMAHYESSCSPLPYLSIGAQELLSFIPFDPNCKIFQKFDLGQKLIFSVFGRKITFEYLPNSRKFIRCIKRFDFIHSVFNLKDFLIRQ